MPPPRLRTTPQQSPRSRVTAGRTVTEIGRGPTRTKSKQSLTSCSNQKRHSSCHDKGRRPAVFFFLGEKNKDCVINESRPFSGKSFSQVTRRRPAASEEGRGTHSGAVWAATVRGGGESPKVQQQFDDDTGTSVREGPSSPTTRAHPTHLSCHPFTYYNFRFLPTSNTLCRPSLTCRRDSDFPRPNDSRRSPLGGHANNAPH